jgi:hypothetical protein
VLITACESGNQIVDNNFTSSKSSDAQISSDSTVNQDFLYENSELKYQILVPSDFASKQNDNEGQYFGYGINSVTGNALFSAHVTDSKCSSQITGASKMSLLNDSDKLSWGKVDYYDKGNNIYAADDPICKLLSLNATYSEEQVQQYTRTRATYASCADNDDGAVVFCFAQLVDNPTLAKEIFETFRWTE